MQQAGHIGRTGSFILIKRSGGDVGQAWSLRGSADSAGGLALNVIAAPD